MAVKDYVTTGFGVGATDHYITLGLGNLTSDSGTTSDARMQRNRRYVQVFSLAFALVGDWLLRTLESLT